MRSSPLFCRPLLAATFAAGVLFSTGRSETVFADSFDDGDVRYADSMRDYWAIFQPDHGQGSGAWEDKGRLHLEAMSWPYMWVSMASPVMENFGFFSRPVTVTLDDIQLRAQGISPSLARFKLSLASTRGPAERASNVISLRVRPGLLLLGYRTEGFMMDAPPETLAGQKINSVLPITLKDTPTKLSLTLGPSNRDGHIRYEIVVVDDGLPITRSGTIPLTIAQWGNVDSSAIIIDARRDSENSQAGSGTHFSAGQITVTR
jgi:hypothetical protein